MKPAALKQWAKDIAVCTVWAYGPDELIARLRRIGVTPGDTLMVHSSWLAHNGFKGKPAEDEAKRKRSIDQIDVTGNAAMARVTLNYPSGTFTDYFVLLKVDGEWKIANKVWTRNPKPATP